MRAHARDGVDTTTRIKSLAQGGNILMLRIEPSTFVSKVDILTTTPIVHRLMADD